MTQIDAACAWRYIRAIRAADDASPAGPGAIEIDANGGWHSTATVTPAAAALFDTLLPVASGGPDYVIGQLGQSLDGRIATVGGDSYYVTGQPSRAHLHRLRALVDAVIVGAGTADADNPRLTVRHTVGDNPVRVVLDPNARVPSKHQLFTDRAAATLHLVMADLGLARPSTHVTRVALGDDPRQWTPRALLARLAGRGLSRVLVEGGGRTVSRFLDADALDRLHMVVAPLLIGSGRPAVSLPEIGTLAAARRPACRAWPLGEDMLFDLALGRAGRPFDTARG